MTRMRIAAVARLRLAVADPEVVERYWSQIKPAVSKQPTDWGRLIRRPTRQDHPIPISEDGVMIKEPILHPATELKLS
jgi:hypothetical protein